MRSPVGTWVAAWLGHSLIMVEPPVSPDEPFDCMETRPVSAFPSLDSPEQTRLTPATSASRQTSRTPEPPELNHRVAVELDELDGVRFQIAEHLGSGGSGQVYRCFDQHLQRHIAIKSLGKRRITRAKQNNLIQEARITARLEHPNILPIYDLAFSDDGSAYYSMREAHGHSLLKLIDQRRQGQTLAAIVDVDAQLEIMLHICNACGHAHSCGIIHQDIKPANIMVGKFGEVVLLDWGTAIDLAQSEGQRRLMGTPAYMSPEQCRGERSDQRSDIYCICASFYHLLTGELLVRQGRVEEFWRQRRQGLIDPLPANVRQQLPPGLLEVLLVGLASDSAQRYQDIPALQQALRAWRRHRDALQLAEQADELLQQAIAEPSHQAFLHCRQHYQQSLNLWPDNDDAGHGQQACLVQHSDFALTQGDLDMASQLLLDMVESPPALRQRIDRMRQQRRRLRHRAHVSWIALAGCLLLALLLLLVLVDQQRRQQADWRTVQEIQPQDWPAAVLAGARGRHPIPAEDRPTGDHLLLPERQIISFPEWDSSGEVRISCEISWPEQVDGFDIIAQAQLDQRYNTAQTPASVLAQVGGYDQVCQLDMRSEPYKQTGRWSARRQLRPGVRYRIELEILRQHLRLSLDGTVLIDRPVLIPELNADWGGLALRGWGPCRVHRLRLQIRQLAEQNSPLAVPDGLLGNGDLRAAYRGYRHIGQTHSGDIREQAWVRAIGVGARLGPEELDALDDMRRQLEAQYPHSRWLQSIRETLCLAYWRHEQFTEALQRADVILNHWANSDIAVGITSLPHGTLPKVIANGLMHIISRSRSIHQLDLNHYGLRDISALHNHQLLAVDISGNRVEDLSPLTGLPLRDVRMNGNPVQDLSPLRGAALRSVVFKHCQVTSLVPLADCPQLQYVDCSDNPVSDLSPLAGLAQLEVLKLRRTAVSDLTPLADMSALKEVRMDGCAISDLGPLAGSLISELTMDYCPVADLRPLAQLPLQRLDINRCPVTSMVDIPIRDLKRFSAHGLHASDFTVLAAAPLQRLELNGSSLDDPGWLFEQLPQLQQLSLTDCPLPAQLRVPACQLRHLSLAGTGLNRLDLEPGAQINHLDLSRNGDLELHLPTDLALRRLSLDGTAIGQTWRLVDYSTLQHLRIDQHSMTAAEAGALYRLLLQHQHRSELIDSLQLSMSLAWPNGYFPAEALYDQADGIYLDTGRRMSRQAAQALAARLQARLPTTGLPQTLLRQLIMPNNRIIVDDGLLHDTNHANYLRPEEPGEGGLVFLYWPKPAIDQAAMWERPDE